MVLLVVIGDSLLFVWTPHLTRRIFSYNYTHMRGSNSSRVFVVRASLVMIHPHALMCLFWLSSTTPLSPPCSPSSLLSSCPSSCPSTLSSRMRWTNSLCTLANEDLGTLAEYDPLTGYELNDYLIMEATETYIQESLVENGSPNDFGYDDATIGKALSSPLFTQEREDEASRRRPYHSQDEGLSSSQSSSVSHDRTGWPVVKPFDTQISSVREIPNHRSESEQIRILLERQKEQILADCQAEIRKHEFQADHDRRSIQKLNEMLESQKKKFVVLINETNDFDEIIKFLMNSYWSKIGVFVKLMIKGSVRWKNWSDFEAQHSTQLRGENWSRIEILSLNSQARYRNYRTKSINCMNDSRYFQDAVSVRSGKSHVASQPVFFPLHPDPGGMPSRKNGQPSIWDRHGISGIVFLQIQQRLLQHFIRRSWTHGVLMYQNTHHHMWWVRAKHHFTIRDASQDRQPEIQSSLVREIFQRIIRQTNNDCRSQIFILTNSPRQQHSLVGKIRFKTEVCPCSEFPTEAMLWIKEVQLFDPVDDLKSSSSLQGNHMPNFEVLDAKISSALNRNIHNTQFKKKGQSGGTKSTKRGPFPSWKTDRLPDLRPICNCSAEWWYSGIRLEMGRNSLINDENPIWWHLWRIVQTKNTRVWETQDRIGIVQYGDSPEESWTWWSQIEDNGEKKYRAKFTN